MSEINIGTGHKQGPGVQKTKKLSTRVDLTPMVDLGFLLITFFIFTATISEPASLKMYLPKDTGETPVKASGALTMLLAKNDIVYYYEGELLSDGSNVYATTYPGIREVIIGKKKSSSAKDLIVIIKPQKESMYKNTVDALDEMTISDVKRYALTDILPLEEKLIEALETSHDPG